MAKPSKPMYFGIQGNINTKRIAKIFTPRQIEAFKLYGPLSDIGHYILENLVIKYGNKNYITVDRKHLGQSKKGRCFDKTTGIHISTASGKSTSETKALGMDKEFLRELIQFKKDLCDSFKNEL